MSRTILLNTLMGLMLVALWGQPAWAESLGEVRSISVQDARGRWRLVEATGEATMERAGQVVPLNRGLALMAGDRITTALVRVEISLEEDELLQVAEGSVFVLEEGGIAQELGQIYLQLRRAFTVRYGTVEATVEGTRFVVSGPDPVWVGVSEGRVRVREGEQERLVQRGEQVRHGLTLGEVEAWSRAQRVAALQRTWLLGRPRVELRVLTGPRGLEPGEWMAGVNIEAELALGGGLGLSMGGGLAGNGSGLRLPGGANLTWSMGEWSISGGPVVELEQRDFVCELSDFHTHHSYKALHIGAEGRVRGGMSLGRRLRLLAEVRAAYTDSLTTEVRVGMGVGL